MRQIYVTDDLLIPYDELEIAATRSSGPGGQHVNTTDSRVQVRFLLAASRVLTADQRRQLESSLGKRLDKHGALHVASQKHRSQLQNREAALARLAEILRDGLYKAPPRRPTKPTRGQKQRRLESKHRRAEIKQGRKVRVDE